MQLLYTQQPTFRLQVRLTEALTSSCSLSCSRLTVSSQSLWIAPNEDTCECLRRMSFVMEKNLRDAGDAVGCFRPTE